MPYARSMSNSKLVIRSHAPVRKRVVLVLSVVLAALALLGLYELGQRQAGFNRLSAELEMAELKGDIRQRDAMLRELEEKITVLATAAKIDREAYAQVEAELGDLQARIVKQQEDIAFYRGIVTPDDSAGLRIQNFSLSRGVGPLAYNMQLVLAQAFRSDRQLAGHVELNIEGVRQGEAVRLSLSDLRPDATSNRLKFSFRYFQDLKTDLVLPKGFSPQRVIVKITPQGKSAKTVEESFEWAVKSS